MDPILGMMFLFGGNFAPSGYAMCNGVLLAIQQNAALFSILGTYYGGNGVNTFALPDLRGRTAVSYGQAPGLASYTIGQTGGVETVTLSTQQIPAHNHGFILNSGAGTSAAPNNSSYISSGPLTGSGPNATALKSFTTDNNPANLVTIAPGAISTTGGTQAHNNMQPYLVATYIIALQGIFPSRS